MHCRKIMEENMFGKLPKLVLLAAIHTRINGKVRKQYVQTVLEAKCDTTKP